MTTKTKQSSDLFNNGEFSGDEEEVEEARIRRRLERDHRSYQQHHHSRHHHHHHHRSRREEEEEEDYHYRNRRSASPPPSSSYGRRRRFRDEYDGDGDDRYYRRDDKEQRNYGGRERDRDDRDYRDFDRGGGGGRARRRENDDENDNDNNNARPKFGVPEEMEKFHEAELPNSKKKSKRSFDRPPIPPPMSHGNEGRGRQHGRDIERNAQNRLNMAQQWLQSNGYEETQKQNEILRKRREVYVGNLIQGVVTPNILADVFNALLKKVAPKLCEREIAGNPVVNVIMDSQGSFGFVELRCFEMAQIALRFDKVDVCGRPMNVGRPKGYIEDPRIGDDCPQEVVDNMIEFGGSLDDDEAKAKEKELAKAKAAAAAAAAAKIAAKMKTSGGSNGTATTTTEEKNKKKKNDSAIKSVNMRLENLLSLDEVEAAEKKDKDGAEAILEQLLQACLEECEKTIGMVMALAVPTPTQDVFNNPELRKGGARCYVKFDTEADAEKGVSKMNGREFGEENVIKATLVTDEEFEKASENIWV